MHSIFMPIPVSICMHSIFLNEICMKFELWMNYIYLYELCVYMKSEQWTWKLGKSPNIQNFLFFHVQTIDTNRGPTSFITPPSPITLTSLLIIWYMFYILSDTFSIYYLIHFLYIIWYMFYISSNTFSIYYRIHFLYIIWYISYVLSDTFPIYYLIHFLYIIWYISYILSNTFPIYYLIHVLYII